MTISRNNRIEVGDFVQAVDAVLLRNRLTQKADRYTTTDMLLRAIRIRRPIVTAPPINYYVFVRSMDHRYEALLPCNVLRRLSPLEALAFQGR